MTRLSLYAFLCITICACALNPPRVVRTPVSIKSVAAIKSKVSNIKKRVVKRVPASTIKRKIRRAVITSCLVRVDNKKNIDKLMTISSKVTPRDIKYLEDAYQDGESIYLLYKANISSGALRNMIIYKLNELEIVPAWLESRIVFNGPHNGHLLKDFVCRVQLARDMGQIILRKKLIDLSGECLHKNGEVRSYSNKKSWGIIYRTDSDIEHQSEVRSTLDAIEYKMSLLHISRKGKVSLPKSKNINSSPLFSFVSYPWEELSVLKDHLELGDKRVSLLNSFVDQKYSEQEQLKMIKDFLLENDIYGTVLESIGISVP